jgi:transcriptional regulator with XRE-family HTH domain
MVNRAQRIPANEHAAKRRERWRAWFDNQMTTRDLTNKTMVDLLDRPGLTKDMVSRWRSGESGASVEAAIRIARVFDLPATRVLREAGHDDVADYIADVAGSKGTDASAIEPLLTRVRQITSGLTEEQRDALTQELVDQLANLYLVVEKKTEILRASGDQDEADRGAS